MVGMAAALAVVTVLACATIGATSPCSNVNWTLQNYEYVHDFTGDSCLYILYLPLHASTRSVEPLNWNKVKEMCESLDHPYLTKWRLVEPRTSALYNDLKKILEGVFGRRRPVVWIGLVRYVVENRDQLNRQIWADQSKWLWDSDNSTLLSTFSDETPWGHGYPRLWDQKLKKVCVNLFRHHKPTDQFMFNDDPCESAWLNQALACELIDNSEIATTTTSTTTTTMTQPNATEVMIEAAASSSSPDSESSPWMWVGIVVAIIVVLAVVAFLAYRAVQHRRKREPFMLSADSDQSGPYENMPRYKGKRRKKVCDDDSESEALDTSKVSTPKMVCKSKKPTLSWMIDRKDEPKSPVLVQVEGKAAAPKQLEGTAERKSQKEKPKEGKAESKSLKTAVTKKS